jgi:very-short-patch-repair endonuclease
MTNIFNKSSVREQRRMLRRNMPEEEVILWSVLKNRQLLGQRFLRQYSIGEYIVDFYCPNLKLVIEVDGKSHLGKQAKEYDETRTEFISFTGIKFLRFTNKEIHQNLSKVITTIKNKIREHQNVNTR